ncbi:MAG: hypothetical protein JWQ50_2589 [Caballeronia mineralivorans]|jgi:hypothetical protein|nr:hypothetical protein [Caballeronia mineralivorans]MEA3097301.1 hypothetical protein [Caballeronia mineralivorans]
MTKLLSIPSRCGQGHITLLIHLWPMAGAATCYSVFVALWRRTRVLCTRDHPRRFRWNLSSYSVSHVRWDLSNQWCALGPLAAHYPPTAAFLIKQPYEIVRLRSTEV